VKTRGVHRNVVLAMLLLPLLALLAGCGGGGANNASGTGRAALSITWPTRSRLIPLAANSIRITFTQNGTVVSNQLVPRLAAGGTSSVTVNNLKVGAVVMAATAYPNADGTGTAQATGSTTINIADNQTTNVTLTMNSTIDHLEVTPSPLTVAANGSVQVVATAKDASGAVVLTTPGKFTYNSATTTVATIDANGLLHGVLAGSSQITVVETESNKQVVVTANVTAAPGPNSIYVADGNGRLVRIDDMTGANWTEYSGGFVPSGVWVDSANRIYSAQDVAGPNNPAFRINDMSGTGRVNFNHSGLDNPRRIAVDKLGRIYILTGFVLVRMDDMLGNGYVTWAGPAEGNPKNWDPNGIAFDSQNRIYIGDEGTDWTPTRIIRIDDMTGANMVTYAGSGGAPHSFLPVDVAVDSSDHIYIADYVKGIERMDDMSGTNFVSYGTVGSGVGQFSAPLGISFDSTGRIHIADRNNNRIVRIDNMTGANWASYGSAGSGVGQFALPHAIYIR
jgi:hypothetical protein